MNGPLLLLMYFGGLAVGVAILIKAADWFTDAAVEMARRARISEIVVGATIVSLATTLPEFAVSFSATIAGKVDMAVGNAVGSTICNVALILGLCAALSPMGVRRQGFQKSVLTMLSIGLLFGLLSVLVPQGSRIIGVIMLGCFAAYSFAAFRSARAFPDLESPPPAGMTRMKIALLFLAGAVGVVGGSTIVVRSAEGLARAAGVSELVISLTLVAVGTSTPELVVAIASLIKKQRALSVGNIIGANILNLAWVIGASSIVRPLPVRFSTRVFDIPVMLLLSVLLLIFGLTEQRLTRWEGLVLLAVYAAYLLITFTVFRTSGA